MGVLFSRGPAIDELDVNRLCRLITSEGHGTIGVSAILTPNTYLLLGQNDTIARFKAEMHEFLPDPAHIKINPERWPPLHTPIVRQKHIPDRAAVMMDVDARRISAPLPARPLARHRRTQLRRLPRPRHPARLGRSPAAAVGRRVRNAFQRHHDRDPRRPGAERDSGHVPPLERKRAPANGRPHRSAGWECGRPRAWPSGRGSRRCLPSRAALLRAPRSSTSFSKTGCWRMRPAASACTCQ